MKYNIIVDNVKNCPYDDKEININMCNDCFFYNDCYTDNKVIECDKSKWV